ncbi:hypothetical protein FBEOM_717 [Fusarium beomiforme]|uniref:CBM-cenC domain-containing protein n=1 Tax=Fusarium beomiforme TaxID=44412 RepID=A0A9P5E6E8_9HYPO|nr:hypothetical protein FBEOM_717 [Fusarium beomiforme]
MRILVLQLLAISQLASASPCKPVSSSGSLTFSTTSAESTALSTISSSTLAEETETSTTFLTESTAVSETETATSETESVSGSTTEGSSDSATSTVFITTSSAESTTVATSSTEPTTTTATSVAEPTNVLVNPGFEDAAAAPWHPIGQFGTVSITDEGTHSGVYSGHYYADLNDQVVLGVDHPIDPSLIKVDQEYTYSIWIKTTTAVHCQTRTITCGSGGGHFKSAEWASQYNEWTQFTMSCTWNQMLHNLGPSIQIRGECQSLEFYVDDAVVIEAN